MPAVTIRAVLFDFGGVILSSPFDAFARYEAEHGLPRDFIRTVNATDPDTNAWARLERSEVDLAGFAAAFADESEALGHRIDGQDVLLLLAGDIRPTMVEAVRRCHAAHRTALLTNNILGMDASPRFGDVHDLFHEVVESSRLGIRKPDPAFYEHACSLLEIEPNEAVFLDDLGINLKPAKAMGMTTIKVGDPEVAIDELEQVLGLSLR